MIPFQVRLEAALASFTQVAALMQMNWAWPITESIHFVGLTLLFGSIAAWDLRLIGLAKQVPIAAFHRLIPFAILGFATNAASGTFFLMTDPDQYVYNPAFHLKMLCVILAGANVVLFYLTMYRRVNRLGPGAQGPVLARLSGAVSLVLWVTVIICGRMITFYRPALCRPGDAAGFLADCIVR
ncbi:MAG: hypothetical protein HW394_2053 [Acidobacteria bacterium]|nr:hypothetical protein [Acidobacteriota bacterium]